MCPINVVQCGNLVGAVLRLVRRNGDGGRSLGKGWQAAVQWGIVRSWAAGKGSPATDLVGRRPVDEAPHSGSGRPHIPEGRPLPQRVVVPQICEALMMFCL
ncbi:hypothetical protein GCM10010361_15330 [Streptomyces olivaceiscleroticus]|uniref:Uncharacterized protein n=1 Tax=Streptomyces olivaceiscleroticus TaxID=68245 RepID=A0ABN0ZLS2_9ACTN